jgi:hypothetical protein
LRSLPELPRDTGSGIDGVAGVAGSAAGGAAGGAPTVVVPAPKSGNRKPATDFRSWAERAASFAMDVDVAVDPSAVCDDISRTTCMFLDMFPDAAACCRALAEMFCTRLAI